MQSKKTENLLLLDFVSPIKRAVHETCKYDINYHGWSHHQGENKFTSSNAESIQRIHLTTDVTQFSHPAAATRAAAPLKALCSAPATRKPAAAKRRPRAPQLLQKSLWSAPATATRALAPLGRSLLRAYHRKACRDPRVSVGAPKRCNKVSGFSFNQAVKNKNQQATKPKHH